MEIIESLFAKDFNFDTNIIEKESCFLDIETTGLNRGKDIIYLIGILYFNEDRGLWTLAQVFANDKDKEKDLLMATMDLLSNCKQIINYNGNSFDIPFINQRLKHHSIDNYISKEKSLDLYSIIRSNRNILNLPNLKLETVEEYLNIYRKDIYSGKECIQFYKDYVRSKEEELKDRILQHNYEDLYYLIDIIEIINILEDKKSFNILYNQDSIKFTIDTMEHSNDFFIIKGYYTSENIIKAMYYEDNYTLIVDEDESFKLTMEIQEGLVAPEVICMFIIKEKYPIDNIIVESPYRIPENIILLRIEKKYIIENIINVISAILQNTL